MKTFKFDMILFLLILFKKNHKILIYLGTDKFPLPVLLSKFFWLISITKEFFVHTIIIFI